eukprot:GFUD01115508.1.p1 GENE.GFUD01115508.1~~GFUD01115508.1.p1  ORF type:complete len:114 (-),score=17.35 GFUD01115508.1:55-396(-)
MKHGILVIQVLCLMSLARYLTATDCWDQKVTPKRRQRRFVFPCKGTDTMPVAEYKRVHGDPSELGIRGENFHLYKVPIEIDISQLVDLKVFNAFSENGQQWRTKEYRKRSTPT